jgi:hypothetical protein
MTKKIFPGNFVNYLSSYQGQPIVAVPGRAYHHKIGYIKVDATARREFDVIIPSPDKRPDDKPRPDIVGLTVPNGAYLYHIGLRILDARKDLARGTARSGLIWGANGDRIKLASAVAVNGAALTATTASTTPIGNISAQVLTAAPQGTAFGLVTAVQTSAELTLKLYYDNGTTGLGDAAGLTSQEPGGSFLVAEVAYFTLDGVPDQSAFGGLPAIVETV